MGPSVVCVRVVVMGMWLKPLIVLVGHLDKHCFVLGEGVGGRVRLLGVLVVVMV